MGEPTIYEVAKEAGVSAATVSRAINGRDRISEATRRKVFEACERLGFSVSRTASMLRTGKSNRIALTVGNSLAGWFSSELAEGVYSTLSAQGYDLLSYRLADAAQRRDFFASMPVKRNADAFIISSFDVTDDERQALEGLGMPVVGVNTIGLTAERDMVSIGVDDIQAMRQTIHQLAGLGHRHIAFVHKAQEHAGFVWEADQRIEGYRLGMRAEGLDVPEGYVIAVKEGPSAGADALGALLALDPRPTAVCCISDENAIPLVHELRAYGFDVPGDMSVVGFDDWPLAQALGLSTVRHDPRAYGAMAADIAIRLSRGEQVDGHRIVVPTRLMLRGTVGPARRA
ncbi:LacI family DNA-binding transcriptional regulator [Bifidobacterium sp. CP2]|uniref:LacI family DNA-binding transcriptional regulator n=1 Tax=Bifidobacterium sp. CP2 TaxID=2809025 RepID=UPI001BDD6987|nr:LacI family DNA-binding transcriptional regulator [Bifidobacterium sp. CP2]MBT1181830.1 LacI family DNA-binding transcriptional regulator [Bifidobacterium sp. CP2]